MNEKLKLGLYAVLVILGIWFGFGFYSSFSSSLKTPPIAAEPGEPTPTNTPSSGGAEATNVIVATNDASLQTNDPNAAMASTNSPGASNQTATAAPPPSKKRAKAAPAAAPSDEGSQKKARGGMIGDLAGLVAVIICLGLLAAHDLTQFMGGRATQFIFDDEGEAFRDPEYERGEQVWANGKPLEAIQIMRDYLKEHPNKQYVALRIAEIYEKDLQNLLAAALEYEEILKYKLPPERWGWAAVHLCNLYSKVGQPNKSAALLQRIVDEYPETAAAKKARARLGLPEESLPQEGEAPPQASGEDDDSEPPPSPESKSNLPPGFRPKK